MTLLVVLKVTGIKVADKRRVQNIKAELDDRKFVRLEAYEPVEHYFDSSAEDDLHFVVRLLPHGTSFLSFVLVHT